MSDRRTYLSQSSRMPPFRTLLANVHERSAIRSLGLVVGFLTCLVTATTSLPSAVAQNGQPTFAGVQPGQSYAEARRRLLGAAYTPQRFNADDRCSGRPVCKTYPEAEFCAGTGLANCRFAFRDPAGALIVIETQGEEQNRPGRKIGLDLGVKTIRKANATEVAEISRSLSQGPAAAPTSPRQPFEGIWANTDPECQDEEGPNSRTLIDLRNLDGRTRVPLLDQYENHCRIVGVRSKGVERTLSVRCHQFWEDYQSKRGGVSRTITLSPGWNGKLLIDGATFVSCKKLDP